MNILTVHGDLLDQPVEVIVNAWNRKASQERLKRGAVWSRSANWPVSDIFRWVVP